MAVEGLAEGSVDEMGPGGSKRGADEESDEMKGLLFELFVASHYVNDNDEPVSGI